MKLKKVVALLLFVPVLLQAEDLRIVVTKKAGKALHEGTVQGAVTGPNIRKTEGQASRSESESCYEVKVTNNSFQATKPLQARYILFVERQELGAKKGVEATQKVTGEAPLEPIASRATASFTTVTVKLGDEQLPGGYYYNNGGRIKAQDTLKGIWTRLFDGDTLVAEFVQPPTLSKREKWEPVKGSAQK